MKTKWFLLTASEPPVIEEFDTDSAAVKAYGERECQYPDTEVVLLGADSLETLRITHSHYFD